jgi:hypothetical protein
VTVFKEKMKLMLRSANFVREGFEDRKEIINGCQSIQRMTDVNFVAKR